MQAVNRSPLSFVALSRPAQALVKPSNVAQFSSDPYIDEADKLYPDAHKRLLESEQKLKDQLSEKKRNYFQAYRLAIIKNY